MMAKTPYLGRLDRKTTPERDWLDDLAGPNATPPDRSPGDHAAGMQEIAAQLARMGEPGRAGERSRRPVLALQHAVAEIAERQAALDGPRQGAAAREPAVSRPSAPPSAAPSPEPAHQAAPPSPAGARPVPRPDLATEVSETFARFSRDILQAIDAVDVRPQVQAIDRQIRLVGHAVEGLGERAATPPAWSETLDEVRGLLKQGGPLTALADRVEALASRIERDSGGADPGALLETLGARLGEIERAVRDRPSATAAQAGALEAVVQSLGDRLLTAREASSDLGQLEAALRDAARRLDELKPGTDPKALQALETQIARIGERLDRSESSLRALDGVERSLGELFSQFEVTRQVTIDAAETAARTAARDTLRAALQTPEWKARGPELSGSLADQVTRGIEDLRAMQEIAQRRTTDAFGQIQEVMERLERHLSAIDGSAGPSAAMRREPRRNEAPRPRPASEAVPEPEVATEDDTPIEPGLGRGALGRPERGPSEPSAAPTLSVADEAEGSASFIAAARRAAQAAQMAAANAASAGAKAERGAAPRRAPAQAAGPGLVARTRAVLAQRRRPFLLGVAALVLLVGALEVAKIGFGSGGSPDPSVMSGREAPPAPAPQRRSELATAPQAPGPVATAQSPAPAPATAQAARPAPAASAPLPTFAGGPARSPAAADVVPEGLRTLAVGGDAAAQYELGTRIAEGRGTARDPKEAAVWFGKAAAQGLAPAEYRLGSAYEKGVGVERDPALAMAWYGKAAEAGNVKAMHNLAVMAAEGAAGKPDYAKAAQWFERAASFGVRDSEFNLAILYARGLGIEQSLAKSYQWFAAAAAAGDEDAAKKRDEVGAKLDPAGLAAAKAAAEAFQPRTPTPAANDVTPPPGGWDAAGPKASAAADTVHRL